ELIFESSKRATPMTWTRDGRTILFNQLIGSITRLERVELIGDRKPTPVLQPVGKEYYDFGQVSPDGHWIVYTSRESGHGEIYVGSYPSLSTKYQIWNDAASPLWRDDGREILFMAARGAMMSVKVQRAGDGLTFSAPEL